jgi:hypothetical protein
MALKPKAIELHIEELVLDGFAPGDRLSIGDAVERELSRLIAENGPAEFQGRPMTLERMDAGAFKAASDARPQAIGGEVASAVYRGLSSPARPRRGLKPRE